MKADFWPEEIQALARALSQLLEEMGTEGTSVSAAAKARARIAYEPFADEEEKNSMMTIEAAWKTIGGQL